MNTRAMHLVGFYSINEALMCICIFVLFRFFRCAECPPNFRYISSVNGCYKVVTRSVEWPTAGLECRALHKDAHLLVVNDDREQLAIAGLIASTNRWYWFTAK